MPTIGIKHVGSARTGKIKHQPGPRGRAAGPVAEAPPGPPRRTRTRTFRGSVGNVTMIKRTAI